MPTLKVVTARGRHSCGRFFSRMGDFKPLWTWWHDGAGALRAWRMFRDVRVSAFCRYWASRPEVRAEAERLGVSANHNEEYAGRACFSSVRTAVSAKVWA